MSTRVAVIAGGAAEVHTTTGDIATGDTATEAVMARGIVDVAAGVAVGTSVEEGAGVRSHHNLGVSCGLGTYRTLFKIVTSRI